ncbi:hypothetical protein KQX54_020490 [Cotesia glomerata]|uniref:Uncharacterized protein n=1 Tax=Cotesia glomerata TaxID=32391 RepID=A0AAV7J5R5_COTGL|nr:hypothetical protein KQX54_020490 [Cotesia glomerata]
MKISGVEASVPLLGAMAPRCIVKQATVKRCVAALLLVSVASIFYYTHYVISTPLSRSMCFPSFSREIELWHGGDEKANTRLVAWPTERRILAGMLAAISC